VTINLKDNTTARILKRRAEQANYLTAILRNWRFKQITVTVRHLCICRQLALVGMLSVCFRIYCLRQSRQLKESGQLAY